MHKCSPVDIGKRLKTLRKKYAQENGKRFSQADLAKELGYSREQVAKWETGVQDLTPLQLDEFASFYSVTIDKIVSGVDADNRSISETLGLSDEAITRLKKIKSREVDFQESFVESVGEAGEDSRFITEGGTTEEVLYILNWILSHSSGINLLSLLSKYCLIDASQAFRFNPSIPCVPGETYDPMEELEEVYFENRVGDRWTQINPSILRYALIPAITDVINIIKDEISKEA